MNKNKTVMISSTSIDLPEHRKQVMAACERLGFFPKAMENLPARDADAIRVSLEMVDTADVYIGIYAWRYGHIPDGCEVSITEMEFNRAVERKIPILVFTIHKDHPLLIDMVEVSDRAKEKLTALKEKACHNRGRREFKSTDDLRGEIIHALADLKQREQAESGEKPAPQFHPVSHIPSTPEPYIAHPYTLLHSKDLVGRQRELNRLTDWVTVNREVPAEVHLFNVVAIGGMGKSALTWKWFNAIAPLEMPTLAGRLWWSFYESDAHYENFVIRALAYAAGMPEEEVRRLPSPDREDRLFRCLDERSFLLVLDGLERILLAYARMDAAHLADDDLDERTANAIAAAQGLPDSVKETYLEKHRLRRCADPRAGRFLRRLAQVRASRVLISTRLYPAELQTVTAEPVPGCYALFLNGLGDDDALNLWREFGVSGAREDLLPLFKAFGNYPLLLRALAGEVAEYRPAPGDFGRWRADHPGFNPAAELDLKNAKTHVLQFALEGLGEAQRRVLHTLAAFRMPAGWETVRDLMVGEERPCADDQELDRVLTELEDRGLVGWDKRANRYDLHPIVRGVVWAGLNSSARHYIYGQINGYFDAAPRPPDWRKVESIEDLITAIELYNSLIELRRYDEAFAVFQEHLDYASLWRLNDTGFRKQLLEMIFTDSAKQSPELSEVVNMRYAFHCMGIAYAVGGEPLRAISYYQQSGLREHEYTDIEKPCYSFADKAFTLWLCGRLKEAEIDVFYALIASRSRKNLLQETNSLHVFGMVFGIVNNRLYEKLLRRAINIVATKEYVRLPCAIRCALAQIVIWRGAYVKAIQFLEEAEQHNIYDRVKIYTVRVTRLRGHAELEIGNYSKSERLLHLALKNARAVNLVEEELPALTALAELHRRRREYDTARDLLDQVWDAAEHGPYPLLHADARNVLAQIERDQGNTAAAIAAATLAYRLAWCDGPPYAYHFGLTNARRHLQELGAPEPELPPFDASKYEPMPDVELNPRDEFYVEIDEAD